MNPKGTHNTECSGSEILKDKKSGRNFLGFKKLEEVCLPRPQGSF